MRLRCRARAQNAKIVSKNGAKLVSKIQNVSKFGEVCIRKVFLSNPMSNVQSNASR